MAEIKWRTDRRHQLELPITYVIQAMTDHFPDMPGSTTVELTSSRAHISVLIFRWGEESVETLDELNPIVIQGGRAQERSDV